MGILLTLTYAVLFLFQVVWQLMAALLDAVGSFMIGYIVYIVLGLTIQGTHEVFSLSKQLQFDLSLPPLQ